MTSLPKKIIESLDREVRNQLKLAGSIGHPGESGRARENIIAAFIRKLIPSSFGIDTGFVIDAQGGISKQIDIVIYRTDYHPVFEIGGVKHFLVESVVAIVENKARIDTARRLKEALANIASVKELDRANQGNNRIVRAGTSGPPVDRDRFEHQVLGVVVTQKSLSENKFQQELLQWLRANNRQTWLNLYVDVNSFTASYERARRNDDSVSSMQQTVTTVILTEAESLFITDPTASNSAPSLAELAQELVNFLRIAPLVDFLPTAYLWVESKGRRYGLGPRGDSVPTAEGHTLS